MEKHTTRLERGEAEELRYGIMYSKGDGVGTRASRDRHADTRVTVLLSTIMLCYICYVGPAR